MKIFLIIPSLGTGGAERVGVLLANGFCKRGHEVAVFANLQMRQDYKLEEGIERYDIGSQGNKVLKWIYAVKRLRQLSKKRKPDVVIGIMSMCSLVGYIATIGLNIPVVETIHSSLEKPSYAPMGLWEKFYKFYLSKIYKVVTVLTEADRRVSSKKNHNMVLMPNPLAMTPIETITGREKILLAAGRLDDWHYKGFDILIKSFANLLNSTTTAEQRVKCNCDDVACKIISEGWRLRIAGTGSEKSLNYLKQLCKENGIEDSVEFLGFRKDVEKLYKEASIFALSSRYEGFGLVLIEAMSQGCACVACDYKGRQREILCPQDTVTRNSTLGSPAFGAVTEKELKTQYHGVEVCETGILCEPDNVDALADAMIKMIKDDEYRESVRAKAVERSKYYSIENTIDRWQLLLEQIINIK